MTSPYVCVRGYVLGRVRSGSNPFGMRHPESPRFSSRAEGSGAQRLSPIPLRLPHPCRVLGDRVGLGCIALRATPDECVRGYMTSPACLDQTPWEGVIPKPHAFTGAARDLARSASVPFHCWLPHPYRVLSDRVGFGYIARWRPASSLRAGARNPGRGRPGLHKRISENDSCRGRRTGPPRGTKLRVSVSTSRLSLRRPPRSWPMSGISCNRETSARRRRGIP
jgi:hypothetical protein